MFEMDDQERERLRQQIFGSPVKQGEGNAFPASSINPKLLRLFSPQRLERIKAKELRKYKAAQDKKWQNYLEAVSK